MPDGTGTIEFGERFPDRFYDVGIAEQHAVTFAAGLACEGMKPFCAIYSTFLQRAFDQVMHDVALQKLPVVFIGHVVAVELSGEFGGFAEAGALEHVGIGNHINRNLAGGGQ